MKKLTALLCTAALCSSISTPAFAVDASPLQLASEDKVIEYYSAMSDADCFGGMFYEGDTLVVNIVRNAKSGQPFVGAGSPDVNVEYRTVPYALAELERLKDFFADYAQQYSISVLDANESTNQVDLSLTVYDDATINAIKTLADERFGHSEFLNFIDMSGCSIVFTVAYDRPDYEGKGYA